MIPLKLYSMIMNYISTRSKICFGDTFRPMQGVLATILYDQVYQ